MVLDSVIDFAIETEHVNPSVGGNRARLERGIVFQRRGKKRKEREKKDFGFLNVLLHDDIIETVYIH